MEVVSSRRGLGSRIKRGDQSQGHPPVGRPVPIRTCQATIADLWAVSRNARKSKREIVEIYFYGLRTPIWWWPEGLGITSAAIYLSAIKTMVKDAPGRPHRMRLLAFAGGLASLYLFYFGLQVPLMLLAFPAVAALIVFGVLIFYPRLFLKWPSLRTYLTTCVATSLICALSQLVHLLSLP